MKQNIPLKDLATISLGYPFRGRIEEVKGGIPIIQLKDADIFGIQYEQCTSTEVGEKGESYFLQDQDILFSPRGETTYAVCFDQKSAEGPHIASPNFYVIRINRPDLIPAFVAWQLNQIPCQRYFDRTAEGGLIKNIRKGILEETPIIVPSLKKQQQIIALQELFVREAEIYAQLQHQNQQMMHHIAQQLLLED